MTISLAYTLAKYEFLKKIINNVEILPENTFKLNNLEYKVQPLVIDKKIISQAMYLLNIEINENYFATIKSILLLMDEKMYSCFIEKETKNEINLSITLSNSSITKLIVKKDEETKSNYIAADMLLNGWKVIVSDNVNLIGPLGTVYSFSSRDCSCQEFIKSRKPCCHLLLLECVQNNKKLFK